MRVVETKRAFRRELEAARRRGDRVGFVPTMGSLHGGHRSLIDRAVSECGHVAVSIFVNPLQFDRPEDLERYPRDLEADLAACERAGASTAFVPSVEEMYPASRSTTVSVAGLTERLEGASRPGHFDGVTTVVATLFSLAGAHRAYFGEKDFQQLAVVRRMAGDLSLPVEVVGCPTVRDGDGVALSSRNVLLDAAGREAATALFRALGAGRRTVEGGEDRPDAVAGSIAAVVAAEPLARLDYAAAVDARDLTVPDSLSEVREVRLLVAAEVSGVRLIDNCAAPSVPTLAGSPPGRHNRAAGARASTR